MSVHTANDVMILYQFICSYLPLITTQPRSAYGTVDRTSYTALTELGGRMAHARTVDQHARSIDVGSRGSEW